MLTCDLRCPDYFRAPCCCAAGAWVQKQNQKKKKTFFFKLHFISSVVPIIYLSFFPPFWISRSLHNRLKLASGSSSSLTDLSPSGGGVEKVALVDDATRDKGTQQRRAGANATWNRSRVPLRLFNRISFQDSRLARPRSASLRKKLFLCAGVCTRREKKRTFPLSLPPSGSFHHSISFLLRSFIINCTT